MQILKTYKELTLEFRLQYQDITVQRLAPFSTAPNSGLGVLSIHFKESKETNVKMSQFQVL